VGDNVLLAFKAGPHQWVVTMANMLVLVHVAAAFQVGVGFEEAIGTSQGNCCYCLRTA
jgi:hypothetical protein